MLKIWGRDTSSNTAKVLWCAGELGLEYDRIDIGGPFGGNREEPYASLNPNGLVPTIEVDGIVLWESNAIIRYLSAKHGAGSLWPENLEVRAEADQWMDWATSTIRPGTSRLFHGTMVPGHELENPSAVKLDADALPAEAVAGMEKWAILDRYLKDRAYVAGEALTMGDIPAGLHLHRWYLNGWFDLADARPPKNVDAWYKRLCGRPAYTEAMGGVQRTAA